MIDWSASGLKHRVWIDTLDRNRNRTGTLDGVKSFSISMKNGSPIRGSGTIDIDLQSNINLRSIMVRPWVEVSFDGESESYPLLTAFLNYDDRLDSSSSVKISAQMSDTTIRLDDSVGQGYSIASGTVVTTQIRTILNNLGFANPAITESSRTTSTNMYWGNDKTWRNVISDLASVANFAAAYADPWGNIQVRPYVLPTKRPIAHTWRHGETATFDENITVTTNAGDIPNHLVVVAKTNGDTAANVVERWDTDPNSSWSTVTRGYTVPKPVSDVDAADLATLNEKADRLWAEARATLIHRQLIKRWEPVSLSEVVKFVANPTPIALEEYSYGTIENWEFKWDAGGPLQDATCKLREVSDYVE